MAMNVLCIGDVVGTPGIQLVEQLLPGLREEHELHWVIANGENAHQSGNGLGAKEFERLRQAGVDCVTLGDHLWRRRDLRPVLRAGEGIVRPGNLPAEAVGSGVTVLESDSAPPLAVINLMGRVFMSPAECPFATADRLIDEIDGRATATVVEIHAEATSEKQALSWALDGRVSAVVGSHTHVQTADDRILPGGTAALTDMGMTGPFESVLGRRVEPVLQHMRTSMFIPFLVAKHDPRLQGTVIRIDPETGRALSIVRIDVAPV
jgi:hypothetical protein